MNFTLIYCISTDVLSRQRRWSTELRGPRLRRRPVRDPLALVDGSSGTPGRGGAKVCQYFTTMCMLMSHCHWLHLCAVLVLIMRRQLSYIQLLTVTQAHGMEVMCTS